MSPRAESPRLLPLRRARALLGALMACALAGWAAASSAAVAAVPPILTAVGVHDRHPTATFAGLPPGGFASVVFATRPERSTDGDFLREHRVGSEGLSDEEARTGLWMGSEQLDPGSYFVMLRYSPTFRCEPEEAACVSGSSNVLPLTVPVPAQRFAATARESHVFNSVLLELRIAPLGDRRRYRVCWTLRSGRRACARDEVSGYSWDDAATDLLSVGKEGMRRRTRFTWYVGGRRVASRNLRIHRF